MNHHYFKLQYIIGAKNRITILILFKENHGNEICQGKTKLLIANEELLASIDVIYLLLYSHIY